MSQIALKYWIKKLVCHARVYCLRIVVVDVYLFFFFYYKEACEKQVQELEDENEKCHSELSKIEKQLEKYKNENSDLLKSKVF